MLNFRNTSIFFGLLIGVLIILGPLWVVIAALLLYSFLLFLGSYFIQLGFYIRSICSADTKEKVIAFSFDDGPADQYSSEILDTLKQYEVEAAFFCIGKRIPGREKIVMRIMNEGHLIGNHSYSHHFWFDLFSSRRMLEDINQMNDMVRALTGQRPRLFRPPYGVTNPNLYKAIRPGGLTSVGWSIRSLDTVERNEDRLFKKIMKGLRPGAILLFHDTSKTTLSVLPLLIGTIREQGYSIRRLDKMCNLQAYD
jgi:peptidoglycan/xylan/chitin deacetylase (PgdA/CDA1 family)